nr:unnamed protein product [Callosobruchus analis]
MSCFTCSAALVQEDDYHPALKIELVELISTEKNFGINGSDKLYNFRKCRYMAMIDTDWERLQSHTGVNSAVDEFFDIIYDILDRHVPVRR